LPPLAVPVVELAAALLPVELLLELVPEFPLSAAMIALANAAKASARFGTPPVEVLLLPETLVLLP
jgi:hypothetical protein